MGAEDRLAFKHTVFPLRVHIPYRYLILPPAHYFPFDTSPHSLSKDEMKCAGWVLLFIFTGCIWAMLDMHITTCAIVVQPGVERDPYLYILHLR